MNVKHAEKNTVGYHRMQRTFSPLGLVGAQHRTPFKTENVIRKVYWPQGATYRTAGSVDFQLRRKYDGQTLPVVMDLFSIQPDRGTASMDLDLDHPHHARFGFDSSRMCGKR
ncbi:uncharacterized protein LOC129749976 isoform X2 [Uranotaenia lowii]|uniref:uncharacterized protein LOC129749976 isoform X2 n=1 Tax=Uranotaenia lowii TaxID=190385 RepID=UPI0024787C05|nr:uncharacterized protein LOC129749976 isoform X2 [Uranotaenia lowii]